MPIFNVGGGLAMNSGEDYSAGRTSVSSVGLAPAGNGARCPSCGFRPIGNGKVLRWAGNLADSQLLDLIGRLARSVARGETKEPDKIRTVLMDFIAGRKA